MGIQIQKPEKLTEYEKFFFLCFHKHPIVYPDIRDKIKEYRKSKFKYDELKYLLLKTNLEEYTDIIYNYFLEIALWVVDEHEKENFQSNSWQNKLSSAVIDKYYSTSYDNITLLIKNLIFLFANKGNGISIVLKSKGKTLDSYKTDNEYITNSIIESLILKFKEERLNMENMEWHEAERAINNNEDIDWSTSYLWQNGEHNSMDELTDSERDEMIAEFADEHEIEREITISYLESKLEFYKSFTQKKVGAKPKNDNIAELIIRLSTLIRLKGFFNQKICTDINKYPLSNKDCVIIYKLLLFYKLIPAIDNNTTTKPNNLIRSYINNFRKYREPKKFPNFDRMEERINSYLQSNVKIVPE